MVHRLSEDKRRQQKDWIYLLFDSLGDYTDFDEYNIHRLYTNSSETKKKSRATAFFKKRSKIKESWNNLKKKYDQYKENRKAERMIKSYKQNN